MEKEKGHPQAAQKHFKGSSNHSGNSAHSQRMRLVAALEQGSVTTIEARRDWIF
jgi:hypothetical protein